jgi:hypothetical protein
MPRQAVWSRILALLLVAVPLGAAAQTQVYSDRSLANGSSIKRVLFIPPDVDVNEVTAGGVVEKVPDWSKQAREHLTAALRKLAPAAKFEIAPLPPLPAAEQSVLDQHTALYDLVAGNVQRAGAIGGDVWAERLKSGASDYALGPGLAFLADRTGADAALFVIAQDFVSTSERKALAVVGILFGAVLPLGRTFAAAGLVDLRTGRLLWQSYDTSATPDLRVAADAERVVRDLFQSFPGLGTERQ